MLNDSDSDEEEGDEKWFKNTTNNIIYFINCN